MKAFKQAGSHPHRSILARRLVASVIALTGSLVAGSLIWGSSGWAATATLQGAAQPAADVEVQTVRYPSAGANLDAYLARPKGTGKHPAVIVVHDDQGLNQAMQDVTRLFAAAGFVALAPNLAARSAGAPLSQVALTQTVEDVKAAFAYVQQDAGVDATKISAVGFGWGGWRIFKLAEQTPALYRAVVFYGTTPSEIDLSRIRAPILGHYAEYDFQTTGNALATKRRLGDRFTYHIYTDADRGFFGGSSGAIDYVALARAQEQERSRAEDKSTAAGAARLAWTRTVAFLQGS